jgi:hypothetical protein
VLLNIMGDPEAGNVALSTTEAFLWRASDVRPSRDQVVLWVDHEVEAGLDGFVALRSRTIDDWCDQVLLLGRMSFVAMLVETGLLPLEHGRIYPEGYHEAMRYWPRCVLLPLTIQSLAGGCENVDYYKVYVRYEAMRALFIDN